MDIHGGGGGRGGGGYTGRAGRAVASDLYRRVPREMTESTKVGVIMSLLSLLTMIILFVCETWAFSRTRTGTAVEVDAPSSEELLRLNFNVTLYDVHCDFVEVDVWDTLGTNLQNVTKDITKWHIDDRGQKQKFHGRNTQQREVKHQEHEETLRDISDSNGGELHSINLTPENLGGFLDAHDVAIVDYFAPWCIWCQRLAPTWEKFAAEVKRQHIKLGVGKVDCVAQQQMCKDERVMAFPTLRWVEHGRSVMPDYRGDRTVEALVDYARRRGADRGGGDGGRGRDDDEAALEEWLEEHHPGCQVSGHLMVNRVPGNLHVEARSTHHEIHAAAANLTHRVNHLSFGQPRGPQGHLFDLSWFYDDLPGAYKRTNPMAGKYYPTFHPHFAFHHHMKIVTSHAEGGHFRLAPRGLVLYQILEESQKVQYEEMDVPQVKFLWDMSPMSIRLQREGRRWYEYATNLLAIIGGTYTTLGLINATLLRIFKPKKF